MRSVDSSGEKEVLDDGHHFDLAQVEEKLIKLLLVGAVEDQVRPEHKNARRQDWENLKCLEANDSLPEQEDLIDLQTPNECIVHPVEGSLEWLDAELVHVVADLGLVHLKQVLKHFAKAHDRLGLVRNRLQLAEVLAVHRSEDEVALLLGVTDVAKGRTVAREVLDRENAGLGEDTCRSLVSALSHHGCMRLQLDQVEDLSVAVEEHHARLHHVLKDEVLVVVADLDDIAHDQVI